MKISASSFKFSLLALLLFPIITNAQWLEWQDITDTNLELSTVAYSDSEEKDISTADLDQDGNMDLIVVRKEPFSNENEPAKSDLLLMNDGGVLVDSTATFAPEFLTNVTFARDLFIGDFDGDGWEDVVIANTFDQQPIYYHNRGNDANGDWLGLADSTAVRFPTLMM